ncbi:MAG: hypothetical protein FWD17_09170, partial [Polyangiaceae bacterium]|nr:hypothetical protein [Polyangiaceae bacterium]
PWPIAVDDVNVYWGDDVGIWWCPKASCSLNSTQAAEKFASPPLAIAVDDAGIYWSEGSPVVLSVPKGADLVAPTVVWSGDALDGGADASVNYLASDGLNVYFTANDGLLRVAPTDGGAAYSLSVPGAPAGDPSVGVILDSQHVYWTVNDPDAGLVAVASTVPDAASPGASVLVGAGHYPDVIVSDGTSLYWRAATSADATTVAIVTCSIASCVPTVLATTSTDFEELAVDDKAVYWTLLGASSVTGSVWKLAK